MVEQGLKWYDTFVVLFGIILSFADPITDILTLVEFFREDHKTWFGVGLTFVVLPCLLYPWIYYSSKEDEMKEASRARRCTQVFLCGFNPLLPAFLKLETFMFYLKNFKRLWRGDEIQPASKKAASDLLDCSKFAVFLEATLEAAPQFVIQLYATSVQQESVKIIQMISLLVSFLSLVWWSTVADELIMEMQTSFDALSVKNKLLLFATHLFLLSSRLFAISLFTVRYKWWITSVLIFHTVAILVAGATLFHSCSLCLLSCFHWLRDDISLIQLEDADNYERKSIRLQLFSNLLFAIENIAMILSFYFSQFSNNWYALPVTVCVCVFSVYGAIMRVTHYDFLTRARKSRNDAKMNTTTSA